MVIKRKIFVKVSRSEKQEFLKRRNELVQKFLELAETNPGKLKQLNRELGAELYDEICAVIVDEATYEKLKEISQRHGIYLSRVLRNLLFYNGK